MSISIKRAYIEFIKIRVPVIVKFWYLLTRQICKNKSIRDSFRIILHHNWVFWKIDAFLRIKSKIDKYYLSLTIS